MSFFAKEVNDFIDKNWWYCDTDFFDGGNYVSLKRITNMGQEYIALNSIWYTPVQFIELVERCNTHRIFDLSILHNNKSLFNILKKYHPEYFI